MTPEQQRAILEAAAKACGAHKILAYTDDGIVVQWSPILRGGQLWNPIYNSADTANMCAKLDINTFFYHSTKKVECWSDDHGDEQTTRHVTAYNGTSEGKLKAWMEAATMVAAKVGGYIE